MIALPVDPFSILGAVLSAIAVFRGITQPKAENIIELMGNLDPVLELVRFSKNSHHVFHVLGDSILPNFCESVANAKSSEFAKKKWDHVSVYCMEQVRGLIDTIPWTTVKDKETARQALDVKIVSRETRDAAERACRSSEELTESLDGFWNIVLYLNDSLASTKLPDDFQQRVEKMQSCAKAILACCDSLLRNSIVVLADAYDTAMAEGVRN